MDHTIDSNYYTQANKAGQMTDEWTTSTIASLRQGAADVENNQAFRDMCAAVADQLEKGEI